MPLMGLVLGQGLGHVIGVWAARIGGLALIVWLIFLEHDEHDDEGQATLRG